MVSSGPRRICWDSNCFIAHFSEEPGRVEVCNGNLQAAESGEIELYTSFMSLVETVRVPGSADEKAEEQIQSFFENQYIHKVQLEWFIAREARRLQRLTNLKGRDAVHLATALQVRAEVLHTYDKDDLLKLDCNALDIPIRIEEPYWEIGSQIPLI
jgi:predicted nucleic acid-binding protein